MIKFEILNIYNYKIFLFYIIKINFVYNLLKTFLIIFNFNFLNKIYYIIIYKKIKNIIILYYQTLEI